MKGSLLTLIAFSILFVGCAKKKDKLAETPPDVVAPPVVEIPDGPFVPPGTGPGSGAGNFNGLSFDVGGTAALQIVGSDVRSRNLLLSEYTLRSMNKPEKISINVNFVKIGADNWGGTITTAYVENGTTYYWYFSTGSTEEATQYNKWFVKDGKTVFHAVLEDFKYGAVVLVIDDILDLGDGQIEDSVSGSLWFKNYGTKELVCPLEVQGRSCGPHPPTHCWFVSFKGTDTGTPYDCRPWPTKDNYNNTYMSVEPARQSDNPYIGYKKLGTFENLSLTEAFNGEYEF